MRGFILTHGPNVMRYAVCFVNFVFPFYTGDNGSIRFLPYLFIPFQLCKLAANRRKLQCLLCSQTKESLLYETIVKTLKHFFLHGFVNINHHVAAENKMKCVE